MFTQAEPNAPRAALVGCAKIKQSEAPAKFFYDSPLFHASMLYAENLANHWIVSAKHGLVEPGTVLQYYDFKLDELRKSEREDWGARTLQQFASAKVKPRLVILAGRLYADALLYGAHWHNLPKPETPLAGIAGVGKRIAWLKANVSNGAAPHAR
jgi:hypothetical protein